MRILIKFFSLILLVGLIISGYHIALFKMEADILRNRVVELHKNHTELISRYNEAVKKTAITELLVEDENLWVIIRTVDGTVEKIKTPFNPSSKQEIFCDYLVLDNRIWIRRVFDDQTSPSEGFFIENKFENINWEDPNMPVGKAIYRPLTPGRWKVTVTGGGSLGLERIDDNVEIHLASPPVVRDYSQIEEDMQAELKEVNVFDVLKYAVSVAVNRGEKRVAQE